MAKATKKQVLGRGLSAILNDPDNDIKSVTDKGAKQLVGSIIELEVNSIEVNPHQPRTNFNEETLQELASSIKELGVIQPITVRKLGFNKYQLVSGERRLRASKLAGLTTIPAYIRIADDRESLEMALVENIQRQDLDPMEIAFSYQRLIEEINLTQEELSVRVGKNRATISNYLRLVKLDPIIQYGMRDGFISMGHGRALITIEDPAEQLAIYEKIIKDSLSVRETEKLVRERQQSLTSSPTPKKKPSLPIYAQETMQEFSQHLETPVAIQLTASGKGKMIISFKNKTDLERITKLLKGE